MEPTEDSGGADALLAELEPDGLAPEGAGWQQRKSSETRSVILQAAIECLALHGYSRTTTQLIAKTAQVSRGAMLHHYPTKPALITAVIDFAFYRHMEGLTGSIRAMSEAERVDRNAGIFADWQSCLSREYRAYIELNIAARTDEELGRVFLPRARLHARVWKEEILRVFPEWRGDPARFDLAVRVVRSMLDGLLFNQPIWESPPDEAGVLSFLATAVAMLRDGKIAMPG